jgi:hypothetical protein
MHLLFPEEFSQNQLTEVFTISQISDNLYQAKSLSETIILWKHNKVWEGVTNSEESQLIQAVGISIDKYFKALKTP